MVRQFFECRAGARVETARGLGIRQGSAIVSDRCESPGLRPGNVALDLPKSQRVAKRRRGRQQRERPRVISRVVIESGEQLQVVAFLLTQSLPAGDLPRAG